jgi:hypothetical protein
LAAAGFRISMTDFELAEFRKLMIDALETRALAARLHLAAVEFIVGVVDGDPDLIKEARKCVIECEHYLSQNREILRNATRESITQVYRRELEV